MRTSLRKLVAANAGKKSPNGFWFGQGCPLVFWTWNEKYLQRQLLCALHGVDNEGLLVIERWSSSDRWDPAGSMTADTPIQVNRFDLGTEWKGDLQPDPSWIGYLT